MPQYRRPICVVCVLWSTGFIMLWCYVMFWCCPPFGFLWLCHGVPYSSVCTVCVCVCCSIASAFAVVLFVCRASCPAVLRCAMLPIFLMRTGCFIHVVFVMELIFLLYCIFVYRVVQIWQGQTVTCLHTISPGHIWTTLYVGFPSVLFRYICCMLVLVLLSYVPVQIHVDYPECAEHMQIWGHYSLCIL
jgi:hypothetical protein